MTVETFFLPLAPEQSALFEPGDLFTHPPTGRTFLVIHVEDGGIEVVGGPRVESVA